VSGYSLMGQHRIPAFPRKHNFVIPAEAGIHWPLTVAKWIPAFAGMTLVWYEPATWFTHCFRLGDRLWLDKLLA
jgi:hypothetical protein